jgi:hypothetical protein
MNGLDTQRHDTATWVRYNYSSISKSDLKPGVRNTEFRMEIGCVSKTGLYSSVDVPIIHKDWHDKYSLSSISFNPKLLWVSHMHIIASFSKLIFSLRSIHDFSAAKGFMREGSLQPQIEMMAPTHKVHNITAGVIATCSLLVRYYLY